MPACTTVELPYSWLDPSDGDLAMITRFGASPNCTMPCTGDATTRCGGDFIADVYTITGPLPASYVVRNTTFLGCFRCVASQTLDCQRFYCQSAQHDAVVQYAAQDFKAVVACPAATQDEIQSLRCKPCG